MHRHSSNVRFVAVSVACLVGSAIGTSQTVRLRKASFRVKSVFTVNLPADGKQARMWVAVPQADASTEVRRLNIDADYPHRFVTDSWGNMVLYLEAEAPKDRRIVIEETFEATRREIRTSPDPARTRALTEHERRSLVRYLQPSTHVVVNDDTKKLAAAIVGGETNPVLVARRLYDWTYQNVTYWVKDPDSLKASAVGSSTYCLTTKTGNCTDFHSLFSSLAMASGIPNRIVYGTLFKPTLNGFDVDASYHCWIEFFAPTLGWIPLDASLANIYWGETPLSEKNSKLMELTTSTGYRGPDDAKIAYYFGNVDERRVVWSIGRDLMMRPLQHDGPVNALPKMYVEIDGREWADWTRVLTYEELP